MAESYRVVVFMIVAVAATALQLTSTASPVTYTVGDSTGWTVPAEGAAAYQTWAKNHTFVVEDILVFNFINGTHDVAEVTKTAYNTCNAATTRSLYDSAPVRVTLTTPGQHFFICTFPGHCSMGQQLAIDVISAATPPPSSTTTPPPSSPATPPSSSPAASPPSSQGTPPPSSSSAPTATPPSSTTPTATPPSSPNAAPPTSPTSASPSTTVTPTPSSSAALPPSIAAAPSPTKAATPPTPGNSAVRLGVAGNVAVLLSVILVFV